MCIVQFFVTFLHFEFGRGCNTFDPQSCTGSNCPGQTKYNNDDISSPHLDSFRYYGRPWGRQLFRPTDALLATLTGALHRGCTPAPNPKLLPARGRMQGFMEA